MNNPEIAIGEKIKVYRKKREITQEQLAVYLNISFQSVSKWECGDAYPDITMLPKIAMFFGVTTDELLCIDKLKEEKEINEYMQRETWALNKGFTEEAVAIMREINAKYPGNFILMYKLAWVLYTDTIAGRDMENQQNVFKEIISIGEKIRAECKDDKIRRDILEQMCIAYRCIGEDKKAINLANDNLGSIHKSAEIVLERLLCGDELIRQKQKNMLEFARLFYGEVLNLSKDFTPREKLAINKNIFDMYFIIFKDGDFDFYNSWFFSLYENTAGIYIELNDNAKALENLKNASDFCIAFDKTMFTTPHTSPLINKINPVGTLLWKNQKGNSAYNFLKSLADEKYDPIRGTPEFIGIGENLRKYAKEDE